MKANSISESRTSIALTKETITKLKTFTKEHKLVMYDAVDAMLDVVLNDPKLAIKAIELSKSKSAEKRVGKLSHSLNALPKELRDKLKKMSPTELQALLEKSEA